MPRTSLIGCEIRRTGASRPVRHNQTAPRAPETKYARSGDYSVAYQVVGDSERVLATICSFTGVAFSG